VRRRFGYRRIHDLLHPQFPGVNHKRVWRLSSALQFAYNPHECWISGGILAFAIPRIRYCS
jgi:hypothetical protein